jgi:hypothetical protein
LREINTDSLGQKKVEPHRRWFAGEYFDLLVWEDETGEIVGFQLSYDKIRNQHALTWKKQKGYIHNKVDDGESRPGKFKASPILLADGIFEYDKIAESFKRNSTEIDEVVSSFVYNKLKNYK